MAIWGERQISDRQVAGSTPALATTLGKLFTQTCFDQLIWIAQPEPAELKWSSSRWVTWPSLQQLYVIDLVVFQRVSRPALDITDTVSDSNIILVGTLLLVVDYMITCELTCPSVAFRLIRSDSFM